MTAPQWLWERSNDLGPAGRPSTQITGLGNNAAWPQSRRSDPQKQARSTRQSGKRTPLEAFGRLTPRFDPSTRSVNMIAPAGNPAGGATDRHSRARNRTPRHSTPGKSMPPAGEPGLRGREDFAAPRRRQKPKLITGFTVRRNSRSGCCLASKVFSPGNVRCDLHGSDFAVSVAYGAGPIWASVGKPPPNQCWAIMCQQKV